MLTEQALQAAIWKVDRFATHDGPGIRTNLYFKGCPMHCLWCSNPEGQRDNRELVFSEARCTNCNLCLNSCPQGAIKPQSDKICIDFGKCNQCGYCISVCTANALYYYERSYTLSQVMDIIGKDRYIHRKSGGGITCTGGEPFFQMEFLQRLLAECHEQGTHTTVETCGYADTVRFKETLVNIDGLFFDLKHIDKEQHLKLTGRDNSVIIHNLKAASSIFDVSGKVLVIRQVVVPGLNDGDNIKFLAQLAKGLPHLDMIELLPYHAYGAPKYQGLGREYQLQSLEPPSFDELQVYKNTIESYGIKCNIVGL